MKKTLTVNLSGSVFNIDEDAYLLLDKYLTNLRIHFRQEDGSEEIMNDFELRISELLGEKVRLGYNVVTIEQVEEIIKRMGKPEEIFDNESNKSDTDKEHASNFESKEQSGTTKKRFYRNQDDKIIGGVAGGFAAYMGWDPTAVRIALLVLLFFTNIVIIPVYLILWLVMPLAKTASEKLEMRGESVTLENIGKTVTNGFEKVSNGVNDYVKSDNPRNLVQKIGDVLVQIVGIILKLGLFVLAIICSPILLILLFIFIVVIFALFFGGAGLLYSIMPSVNWAYVFDYPEFALVLGSFGILLAFGIPLGCIIYSIFSQLFKYKPVPTGVKWTLLVMWIIGVILSIACSAYIITPIWTQWSSTHPVPWGV